MQGTKVLRGEVATSPLSNVVVDVGRRHGMPAPLIPETQQARGRPASLERLHHPGEVGVDDVALPGLTTFRGEPKLHRVAANGRMGTQQRGQPDAAVRVSVTFGADAQTAGVEHPEASREYAFAGEALPAQVDRDLPAGCRQ